MNVSLNSEMARFVSAKVSGGQFESADEVVHAALSLLRDQEQLMPADVDELRHEIAVGLAQLDGGEGKPWDVEEMKERVRRHHAARQATPNEEPG